MNNYLNIIPSELVEIILSYVESLNLHVLYNMITIPIDWSTIYYYHFGNYRRIGYGEYELYLGLSEFNDILELGYNKLDSLRNLEYSYRDDYSITFIPPQIGYLTRLKKISFNNNKITSIPIQIDNLLRLESLDLGNNQITEIPKEIGNLINLKILNLHGNKIITLPKELINLKNIQTIYLGDNMIKKIPSYLRQLKDRINI